MKRFIWKVLRKCFWMKFSSHWSHPKTGDMYYGEWKQRRKEIRDYRTYRLIGAKNPLSQSI